MKYTTYINVVCTVRTEKKEPKRTRAMLRGNLINYHEDTNLLLIKIFLNSVISTPGACVATTDISNFYLMSPLKKPEFAHDSCKFGKT